MKPPQTLTSWPAVSPRGSQLKSDFAPQGTFGNARRHCRSSQLGVEGKERMIQAQDVFKHPARQRTGSPNEE